MSKRASRSKNASMRIGPWWVTTRLGSGSSRKAAGAKVKDTITDASVPMVEKIPNSAMAAIGLVGHDPLGKRQQQEGRRGEGEGHDHRRQRADGGEDPELGDGGDRADGARPAWEAAAAGRPPGRR